MSSVTVYVVPGTSGDEGTRCAVVVAASYDAVAATVPFGPETTKLAFVMPGPYMARENVASTEVEIGTFVAPAAGFCETTVGAAGALAAVVNVHVTDEASATPSTAVIAVVSFAVYVVENASGDVGVNVAVRDASV